MQRTVVLIGPASVGKSTVGRIVADMLDVPFVDVDEIGEEFYAEVGQPIESLVERIAAEGLREAHRWWQPARLRAATRIVEQHPGSVIAFGAGHAHFEDETYATRVAEALQSAHVVLLLPGPDDARSVSWLHARCASDRGEDWGGLLFIEEWVTSEQHRALADVTVHVAGITADQVAAATMATLDR